MKLIQKITTSITLLTLVSFIFVPATVQAGPFDGSRGQACQGATLGNGGCGSGSGTTLSDRIRTIVDIISAIVAMVSVIMIIIGGFRYVTSAGDSGNISGAKNTIIYAIVGLIVVALAQVIVRFVLSKF